MEETKRENQTDNVVQSSVENCRENNAGPVWQLKKQKSFVLSPISEIASTLGETKIATPTTSKDRKSRLGELIKKHVATNVSRDFSSSIAKSCRQ
jgi:hypothetical protein